MNRLVKRQPRLTKREKKQLAPSTSSTSSTGGGHDHEHEHIHCTACGKHIDVEDFDTPASAMWLRCQHGSEFASCVDCKDATKRLLDEHDKTGQPVKFAPSFH